MQEITNTIFASLLKKYNKISINEIGTFSVLIKQASNEKIGRDFIAPASEINFSNVLSDDFSLENILKKENIFNEENISEIVANYISKIKSEIEKNGQYEFEGIGNLYLDEKNSYALKVVANSFFYGMPNFSVSAKKQKKIRPEKVATKKKIKVPWYVWIILLFILAGVSSYILFPNEIKSAYNKVLASFSKSKKSTQATEPKADTAIMQIPIQENIEDTIKEAKDTTAISKDTLPTQVNKEFFVIAGSYTTSAEADEACKRLIKKGYPNAEVLISTTENRIRLAYDGFPDKESALDFLNKTKIKENQSDIWLLRQKKN